MDKELLMSLGRRLHLTNLDEENEEYILTPEEEEKVIHHHISRAKEHEEWKLNHREEQGILSKGDIELHLSKIDWETKINREQILKNANSFKHQDLFHAKQREKELEEENKKELQIKSQWTAEVMFRYMKYISSKVYEKELLVNEQTKKLISVVCLFLSEDKRFETDYGYSLKKGLLIRGISGLGKTYTVQCVADNELNPVHIISVLEIQEVIKSTGEYKIDMQGRKVLYLDDIGTEEPVITHFGTKIPWVKNFLELYYMKYKKYNRLIVSTNNSFQEIEDKYGFRVRSRAKDMFNIIDVEGEDLRGNNYEPTRSI